MSKERYGVELSDAEVTSFLESRGVGTLAFGDEDGAYSIPMSFGYDSVNDRLVLQMAVGEDNRKTRYVEKGNRVSLSAYDWNSIDDWRSVVVRGTLHRVPAEETSTVAGIFAAHANIASLEVFRQPLDEVELAWYELRVEDIHGRQATH